MRRLSYGLFVLPAVLLLASCGDLLNETPYGVYSNPTFFNTETDAESALMYAYAPINYIEYGSRFLFFMGDSPTDHYLTFGRAQETPLVDWTFSANSDEMLLFFKYAYLSIQRANSVIENVPTMENISESGRRQILGEAYFLRAFNHFNLVKSYGSVPLRDKTSNDTSDSAKPFASIETLYRFIISDLEEAISLTSVRKLQGRTDKVAAQALLSKVYLTLASSSLTGAPGYEWVADGEKMYSLSAKYAGDVLDGQTVYGLDPNLSRIYSTAHQADGMEHIFITSMNREASGEEGTFSQIPQLFGIQTGGRYYISSDLTDSYGGEVEMFLNHTATWNVLRTNHNFYNSFDDADLRKKLMCTTIYDENGTVLATFDPANLESSDNITRAFYYPFCRKYTDALSNINRTSSNVYLIRFAEVALNYAEAAGPTERGYHWINEVRSRAGLPDLDPGLSREAFREAVWQERVFELSFEGHGIYELRRWNRVNSDYIKDKTINEQYAYFYPVPQRESDLNPQK